MQVVDSHVTCIALPLDSLLLSGVSAGPAFRPSLGRAWRRTCLRRRACKQKQGPALMPRNNRLSSGRAMPLHKQSEKACMCSWTRRVKTRDFKVGTYIFIAKYSKPASRSVIISMHVLSYKLRLSLMIILDWRGDLLKNEFSLPLLNLLGAWFFFPSAFILRSS